MKRNTNLVRVYRAEKRANRRNLLLFLVVVALWVTFLSAVVGINPLKKAFERPSPEAR